MDGIEVEKQSLKKEEIKNKENSKNEDSIIIDDDYNKVDKGYMRQVRIKIIKVNQNIEKFVKHVLTFSNKLLNQKIIIMKVIINLFRK